MTAVSSVFMKATARDAAIAAMEEHGRNAMPPVEMAWGFISDVYTQDAIDLPDAMPAEFVAAYTRYVEMLKAGQDIEWACTCDRLDGSEGEHHPDCDEWDPKAGPAE